MVGDAKNRSEEEILRLWTPILLRTILIASTVVLVAGLLLAIVRPSNYYVENFHNIQRGVTRHSVPLSKTFYRALRGDPQALMTLGLMILTLVPLARVLFCFLLFVKEKDWIYVIFTAYVLLGLFIGVALGKIG